MRLSLPPALRTLPGLTLCVITVGGGGLFAVMSSQAPGKHSSNQAPVQDTGQAAETARELSAIATPTPSPTIAGPAIVAPYTSALGLEAFRGYGRVVLFFSTTWCNTCGAFREELSRRLSELPPGVAVVTVDFDQNAQLRDTYSVTTPHTFVQLTSDQETLARWTGGGTTEFLRTLQPVP